MKLVPLELPLTEDSTVSLTIAGDFSPIELDTLAQYVNFMKRVRGCAWLSRGMGGLHGVTFDKSGLQINSSSCTDSELSDLLHVMRPVALESERASFQKVSAFLGRRLRNDEFDQFLKLNKRIFYDGEVGLQIGFSVNTQELFGEWLLHTWLNGTQYHTDADKAQAWAKLETSLGVQTAKAIVLSQLHSRVKALLNLDYIAQKVFCAPDSVPTAPQRISRDPARYTKRDGNH